MGIGSSSLEGFCGAAREISTLPKYRFKISFRFPPKPDRSGGHASCRRAGCQGTSKGRRVRAPVSVRGDIMRVRQHEGETAGEADPDHDLLHKGNTGTVARSAGSTMATTISGCF